VKYGKFVVKFKTFLSSSYETDLRMKQIRLSGLKVFIDLCQNSRPTCPPVVE